MDSALRYRITFCLEIKAEQHFFITVGELSAQFIEQGKTSTVSLLWTHILCYCAETESTLGDTYFTFVYFDPVELTCVQKSSMQTSETLHLHGLDS